MYNAVYLQNAVQQNQLVHKSVTIQSKYKSYQIWPVSNSC